MKKTLIDAFEHSVLTFPDNTFLLEKVGKEWTRSTYKEVQREVYRFGAGLQALGVRTTWRCSPKGATCGLSQSWRCSTPAPSTCPSPSNWRKPAICSSVWTTATRATSSSAATSCAKCAPSLTVCPGWSGSSCSTVRPNTARRKSLSARCCSRATVSSKKRAWSRCSL